MKFRERLLLALIGLLLVALAVQSCRLADSDALVAARTLRNHGWTVSTSRPKIPDLPAGAIPRATLQGGVRYLPRQAAPEQVTLTNPPANQPATGAAPSCDLDSLLVAIDCKAEIVTLSGVPAARLFVHGIVISEHDERELPWAQVGGDTPLPGQPVETAEPVIAIKLPPEVDRLTLGFRKPSQWRVGWVAGVGISYDPIVAKMAPAAFVGYAIQF